jgi:hypothetical protein
MCVYKYDDDQFTQRSMYNLSYTIQTTLNLRTLSRLNVLSLSNLSIIIIQYSEI